MKLPYISFAKPDVLSGLFTLAGFDESRIDAVFTPFGAGCSTIVQYPYLEIKKDNTKSVNMEETFLITESWRKVKDPDWQGLKGK